MLNAVSLKTLMSKSGLVLDLRELIICGGKHNDHFHKGVISNLRNSSERKLHGTGTVLGHGAHLGVDGDLRDSGSHERIREGKFQAEGPERR